MDKPIDITTMSLTELKALGYDQLSIIERSQANLNAINQQIAQMQQATETTVEPHEE